MKSWTRYMLLILLPVVFSNCARYYRITEPASSRVYYTTKYTRTDTGVTRFTNAGNQDYIALRDSEIKRIRRTEFLKATATATADDPN